MTSAGNLDAKHIIHAVTMSYPGLKTNIKVVKNYTPSWNWNWRCAKGRGIKAI